MEQNDKNAAQLIAGKFAHLKGGLAGAMGVPWTTVQHWLKTGNIPPARQPDVLDVADAHQIKIDPIEFLSVELQEKSVSSREAAE